jgi:hypothetical protein
MRGAVPQGSIPSGFNPCLAFDIPSVMAKPTQPARDEEELRLVAIAEACHSEEIAVSDALTNPHQSLIYSEYNRLIGRTQAGRQCGLPCATCAGTDGYRRPRTRRIVPIRSVVQCSGTRAALTAGHEKHESKQVVAVKRRGIDDAISRRFPRVASLRNGCRYPLPRLRRS